MVIQGKWVESEKKRRRIRREKRRMETVMQRTERLLPQRRKLWSVIPALLRNLLNWLQTLFTVDVDRVTEFVFHRTLACYCVWQIPFADNPIVVFAVIDAPLEIVVYVDSTGHRYSDSYNLIARVSLSSSCWVFRPCMVCLQPFVSVL